MESLLAMCLLVAFAVISIGFSPVAAASEPENSAATQGFSVLLGSLAMVLGYVLSK